MELEATNISGGDDGSGSQSASWSASGGALSAGGAKRDELVVGRLSVLWGCGVRDCTSVEWSADGALLVSSSGCIIVLVPRLWHALLQTAGFSGGRMRVRVGEGAAKFAASDALVVSEAGGADSWPGSAVGVTVREGLMELNQPLAPLQACVLAVVLKATPGARGMLRGEFSPVGGNLVCRTAAWRTLGALVLTRGSISPIPAPNIS